MSPCLVLQKENEKSALVSPKHCICLETNVMQDLQPSIILLIPMIRGKKLNMEKTATSELELGQVKEWTVSQVATLAFAFAAFAFSPLSLGAECKWPFHNDEVHNFILSRFP